MTNNNNSNSFAKVLLFAIVALCFSCVALALPGTGVTNLQTTPGVSFETAGSKLTFTAPDKAVLNWSAFGSGANAIATGDTIAYNLPNSTSSVLNVVNGAATTTIDGTLASNGKVYILNPNGIVIGGGARIDTAALALSTIDNPFAGQFQYLNTGKLPSESGMRTASGNIIINGGAVITADTVTALTKDISINGGLLNGTLAVYADGVASVGLAGNTFYSSSNISINNPTGTTTIGAPNALVGSNASFNVTTSTGTIVNSAGASVSARSVNLTSQTGDINVSGINATNTSVVGKNVTIAFGNAANSNLSADVTGNLVVNSQNFLTVDGLKNSSGTTNITSSGKLTLGAVHVNSSAATSFTGSSVVDSADNVFVYGPVSFTSTVGDISITKAGHSFGPVSINSVGNATVYEGAALNLNAVRTRELTLKTGEFFFQTPVTASLIADKLSLTAVGTVNFITGNINNGLIINTLGNVDLSRISVSTNLNNITPSVTTKGTVTNPSL